MTTSSYQPSAVSRQPSGGSTQHPSLRSGQAPAHSTQHRLGTRHWALGTLLAVLVLLAAPSAAAHPADRLTQHLMIRLAPEEARVTIAIGGGLLANGQVLEDLDPSGDDIVAPEEAQAWLADYLADVHVFVDGEAVWLDPATASLAPPETKDFLLGLSPLVVSFAAPVPLTAVTAEHRLVVQVDYRIDLTDFRRDVQTAAGVELIDDGWPSKTTRIAFTADPALAGADGEAVEAASEWGGGLVGRANGLFERPKTPLFFLTLIGVFAVMGALHAIQPGHGKTLVAAYLVATGGKPRDALTLAGVVTFTHTVSVFALGFATLAASQVFLPSRVVPILSVVSGLLVVGMGAVMLRNALRMRQEHERVPVACRLSPVAHHHHDHEHLSEEEHARLHLAEVEVAMVERSGGRRVSPRSLVALGVSGGMAPCPDAMAILLLAVGINQLASGMLAIVAFSLGLAAVLVAFGLAIALAGPVWSRLGRATGSAGGMSRVGRRLVAVSPVASAGVVVLLGLGMLWRSAIGA